MNNWIKAFVIVLAFFGACALFAFLASYAPWILLGIFGVAIFIFLVWAVHAMME